MPAEAHRIRTGDEAQRRGFRDLVVRAQAGDREAMDEVLSALRPHLDHLARPYAPPVRPVESTADLLQESCLRAWRKIDSFRVGRNDEETFALFRAWVGQIVRRMGVDAQRASRRKCRRPSRRILSIGPVRSGDSATTSAAVDPPGRTDRPSAHARGSELDREIREALGRMPDPRDAAIVRMHAFEGLSLTRISQRLNLGYDMVREHYWAAIERLKRDLREWL